MKTLLTTTAILFLLIPGALHAEEVVRAPSQSVLTLRFYPLAELAMAPTGFHFSTALNSNGTASPHGVAQNAAGSGFAGQQGGGLGGGAGTGFYSVPDETALTQLDQLGGGPFTAGDDAAGGNDGTRSLLPEHKSLSFSDATHDTLIKLITENVDSDSWSLNGGRATIIAFNDMLLVKQTPDNQAAVAGFLKRMHQNTIGGQPLRIEVWWLPLNDSGRRNLAELLTKQDAVSALHELSDTVDGYHGQLAARNGISSHHSSGHRMPLVTGKVPVVGNGAIGHQPIINSVHIGIMAEFTPRLQASWEGDGVRLELQTAVTAMNETVNAEASGGDIDRFQLGRHGLESNIVCPLGKPIIAGSLSAVALAPDGDEEKSELTVVIQVSK